MLRYISKLYKLYMRERSVGMCGLAKIMNGARRRMGLKVRMRWF